MDSVNETKQDLRLKLLQKLRGGNRRYPHLNSAIGKARTKLDLLSLSYIEASLPGDFVEALLGKEKVNFRVSVKDVNTRILKYTNQKENHAKDEQKLEGGMAEIRALVEVKKKLEILEATQKEEFNEYGTKSFAFGYPLLIKQIGAEKDDVICAPLFLWYLDIYRDYANDSFVITRSEDNPIIFNEMLDFYLSNEESLDFSDLVDEMNALVSDTGFLSSVEFKKLTTKILDRISKTLSIDSDPAINKTPLAKSDVKDALEASGQVAKLLNSGVLGIYRAGKQSIINDLKNLIQLEEYAAIENEDVDGIPGHQYAAVPVDPSQNEVITSLKTSQNLIIQGPPGTGKSQTLTALITNALANKRRTLVVCEKRTAMEIIERNLNDYGLGDYLAVIESVSKDRTQLVDKARRNYDVRNFMVSGYSSTEFANASFAFDAATEIVRKHHGALAATSDAGLGENKVILGKFLQKKKLVDFDTLKDLSTRFSSVAFSFKKEEFIQLSEELALDSGMVCESHTGLKRIPKAELAEHKNFTIDRESVVNWLSQTSEGVNRVTTEAAGIRLQYEKDFVADVETKHATITEAATKVLVVMEVNREDFSWSKLGGKARLFEVAGSSRKPKADQTLTLIEELQALGVEIGNEVTLQIKSCVELAARYEAHLEAGEKLVNELLNLGATRFNLGASDRVKSVFNSKQKSISLKKGELHQALLSINNDRIDLYPLVDRLRIEPTSNLVADLAAARTTGPSQSTIKKYIYSKDVSEFAFDLGGISALEDGTAIESLPAIIKDRQFGYFQNYKDLVWSEWHDVLAGLTNEYLTASCLPEIPAENSNSDRESYIRKVVFSEIDKSHVEASAQKTTAEARNLVEVTNFRDETRKVLVESKYKVFAQKIASLGQVTNFATLESTLEAISSDIADMTTEASGDNFYSVYRWSNVVVDLPVALQSCIEMFDYHHVPVDSWSDVFATLYFKRMFDLANSGDVLDNDIILERLLQSSQKIKELIVNSIKSTWNSERRVRMGSFEGGVLRFSSLYNKRGAPGLRRNSLRKIVDKDFLLFTSIFPVVICNPGSATSLFALKKDLFDVVLFDEASQLRLEDTFTSLYRGKVKIVSGDEHQMPPSNYFQSAGSEEDVEYDDDENIQTQELSNAESLLDYASTNGYRKTMLGVHYRSDHQDLIEFSNHAFYGGRLMPIPSLEEYCPIEFHAIDGLYKDRSNKDEADYLVAWLKDMIKKPEKPSIGIVTLNLNQSELIKGLISSERIENQEFNDGISSLEERGFFVKNLENVQGDERDYMLLSTTFGKDENGKFKQFFGPIGQRNGYRLLNVLVTRAKHKFIVVSSVPAEFYNKFEDEINIGGKDGRAIFYAYLAYARAISDGDSARRNHILIVLDGSDTYEEAEDGLTESPFEEEVLDALESQLDKGRVKLQYKLGSEKFRIDMVVLDKAKKRPILAIECDGYTYHSSPQAHLYDIYRQQILEGKGFVFYRIWSTNWFHDQVNESRKLLQKIKELDEVRDPVPAA